MLSRYDAVLAALKAGVVIHGADTAILEANDRARELLGLQDLEGKLATDPNWVFLESDGSLMALDRFPVMQVLASQAPLRDLIAIVRTPEGVETWLEVNARPIFDASGRLAQVVVTFIDISERKRVEVLLKEQVERTQLVLASSRLGLWDWNMRTGEVVLDQRWASMVGYQLEELEPVGIETWRQLSHPDDWARSQALIGAHVSGQLPFYDCESRMRHRDGHWIWVHDRGRIVGWTAEGHAARMAGTREDVSAVHEATEALAVAEEESRLAFDRSRVATFLQSKEGRFVRVNPAACDLLDRDMAELLAMGLGDVTHPEDRGVAARLIQDMLASGQGSSRIILRFVTGGGRMIWGDITLSAVRRGDGLLQHILAQILDVTAEHALQQSLLEAERIAHVGRWHLEPRSGDAVWSPELYTMFGLDPTEPAPALLEQESMFTRESWIRLRAAISAASDSGIAYVLDLETVRRDGTHGWIEARGEAVRDATGAIVALHGVSLDITERKRVSEELQTLASRDSLTLMANRVALLDELTRALAASRRSGRHVAVLLMDLDRFKDVNDTFGHAVGDELLVAAAQRIHSVIRGEDLVARLGGDEFVVVMRDLHDPDEAVRTAERLVAAFRTPISASVVDLFATLSVGVTLATPSAAPGDLLREADTAMYAAKDAGRDRVSMFSEDQRSAVTTRLVLERDLRRALERRQLAVWYQPEVDLASGAVTAVEALLRWHHPNGEVWTADRFIGVAEDTGLILDIGDWVLAQACRQAAAWAVGRPHDPITMRVNVSALQLAETGLLTALDEALTSSGLDPALLCIEITETALLRRTATTAANLEGIHARGIALAIDDFGTGYASLTYLDLYPIDVIKIDRSFITGATRSDHRLVTGIVALAKTLGITVIAEGVEQPAQADQLRALGCPSAQGWLYSKAIPAEDLAPLLQPDWRHPGS